MTRRGGGIPSPKKLRVPNLQVDLCSTMIWRNIVKAGKAKNKKLISQQDKGKIRLLIIFIAVKIFIKIRLPECAIVSPAPSPIMKVTFFLGWGGQFNALGQKEACQDFFIFCSISFYVGYYFFILVFIVYFIEH